MHRRPGSRHLAGNDPGRGPGPEQGAGDLADGLWRRAFAHADQDDAVSDRHDVAAFQRGRAVIGAGSAPPDVEVGLREARMKAIDGVHQQRFLPACRPVHRVEGHAAINPRGCVAREQGVGQRRQDESVRTEIGAEHALRLERQIVDRDAADQETGECCVRQFIHPGPQFRSHADADVIIGQPAVEQPCACRPVGQRFREQLVQFEHLDAPVGHLLAKGVMVGFGLLNPEHVVEQKRVAIGRRQAFVREPGSADENRAQAADFGMDSGEFTHAVPPSMAETLRMATTISVSAASSGQMNRSHRS